MAFCLKFGIFITWYLYDFQVLSGEQNTDKLADYFRKQEDENFALFSYVNELSYEVETLNESVQQVQDDIGNYVYLN